MNHYHGDCKLKVVITTPSNGKRGCMNFWCEEHQVMCGKSCYELGWNGEEDDKKLWGKKYQSSSQFTKK